jgi:hypothetical protein
MKFILGETLNTIDAMSASTRFIVAMMTLFNN